MRTMAIQSPRDLFYYDLCVMYDAEQKLSQVLPILARECNNAQAREAFMEHEQETFQHIRNLEQCFQILGSQPKPLTNHAVAGLREDHDTFLQEQPPQDALTMFDLNAGYKSEHIEIAAYHGLIDAASSMGLLQCVQLFQQNLQQEEAAARKLATIAHQLEAQAVQMPGTNAQMAGQPGINQNPSTANQPSATSNTSMASQPYNTQAPNQPVMNQPAVNPNTPTVNQPYMAPAQSTPMASPPNMSSSNSQMASQPSAVQNQAASNNSQIRPGMQVVGSDMENVGQVKDVRDNDFLIDIPMRRDVYAPLDAIQSTDGSRVVLNIPASNVGNMNWPNPPLF
jgi:ferritin-like metal-binding protein YciE